MTRCLVETLQQVGVVFVLAGLAYAFARWWRDDEPGFLEWIGLTAPSLRAVGFAVVLGGLLLLQPVEWLTGSIELAEASENAGHPVGRMLARGIGFWPGLACAVLMATVKTSFAEEVLFRGLIGKRLYPALGFWAGNVVQGTLFGLMHLALVLLLPEGTSVWRAGTLLFVRPFLAALAIGWINERLGDGSILPGWVAHGSSNGVDYVWRFLAGF